MGASSSGVGSRRPNSSTDVSRTSTSRSMRGTMRHRSNAARFAAIVDSIPAPPAMYANASRLIARSAARSSASGETGTRGALPATPPRKMPRCRSRPMSAGMWLIRFR
jgi:hypothetical protein